METVVELHNIQKKYLMKNTDLNVLNIKNLTIKQSQQIALIGQSGSGKTTLLNVIAGLMPPTQGQVYINNKDIYTLNESKRDQYRAKHIGYVFQSFNLVPSLTAIENILLPMYFGQSYPKHKQIDFAKTLLEQVQLQDRWDHKPRQLSRGEQQRVAVARALANRGDIILADEPTGNLDLENGKTTLKLLKDLCKQHEVALLLVTHNPYVIDEFEEVWTMDSINNITEQGEGVK